MQTFDPNFASALSQARDRGIVPRYFFWALPRDRVTGAETPIGFWTGDEDISIAVQTPGGSTQTRTYLGKCNLAIDGLQYVGDLSNNPVSVSLSQIGDATQHFARGLDPRLAYCEIHATIMNGGSFGSAPQLQWVGIIDEGPVSTPAAGNDGSIAFTVRSELLTQLSATNPAKSSDEHQKRRRFGDLFCKYASTIGARAVQWYQKG